MKPPVKIPICPTEHFFLTFQPRRELSDRKLPNVRDYDSREIVVISLVGYYS